MINSKITIKAITAIPRYAAVTSLGALADSGNPAHENKVIGITEGAMQPGYYYEATITGLLFNENWTWVPGAQLYLNGTVLSQTPPGAGNFIQQIGWALTPQSVLINVQSSGTPPPLVVIPPGLISMWSGAIINIPSGWALCDGSLGTPDLRDKFIAGAGGAYAVGATGGAATHTHADHIFTPGGTNTAPTFTGSAGNTGSTSAGTPAGTVSQPTFSGNALATHAHELPFALDGGETPLDIDCISQSVFGTGTTRTTSFHATATANSESQAVALSQAVSAGTPTGTVSQPTFTGSAMGTHSHTFTAAGSVTAPVFTGNQVTLVHSSANNLPPYFALAYIMKL